MQPYQTRVRKMRRPGTRKGDRADQIRTGHHDPDIRAARIARERQARRDSKRER